MTPTPAVTNPSFCANLYQTGATSVDWLGKQAKTLSASAGETLGRVCESVFAFFSSIVATLGQWMNTAREGLLAAGGQIVALPRESKIVGGIAAIALVAITWIASNLWNKAPAATPPAAVAQQKAPADPQKEAPVVAQEVPEKA